MNFQKFWDFQLGFLILFDSISLVLLFKYYSAHFNDCFIQTVQNKLWLFNNTHKSGTLWNLSLFLQFLYMQIQDFWNLWQNQIFVEILLRRQQKKIISPNAVNEYRDYSTGAARLHLVMVILYWTDVFFLVQCACTFKHIQNTTLLCMTSFIMRVVSHYWVSLNVGHLMQNTLDNHSLNVDINPNDKETDM